MFAALADTLMQRLREIALTGTELACATIATIRVKLLNIGADILINSRRIRILLASHRPMRAVFFFAAQALAP
jgi:Transposase DDE domain group 1